MNTLTIEYDGDVDSPCEMDGFWKVTSFNRKHTNFGDPPLDYYGNLNIGFRRKLSVGTAFLLDYFEHGTSIWSLRGEGPQCQWDTATGAGFIALDNPKDRPQQEKREEDARNSLKTYNDWCNGLTFWYSLEKDGEVVDSCGGYIGDDIEYAAREARENFGPITEVIGDAADTVSHMDLK